MSARVADFGRTAECGWRRHNAIGRHDTHGPTNTYLFTEQLTHRVAKGDLSTVNSQQEVVELRIGPDINENLTAQWWPPNPREGSGTIRHSGRISMGTKVKQ